MDVVKVLEVAPRNAKEESKGVTKEGPKEVSANLAAHPPETLTCPCRGEPMETPSTFTVKLKGLVEVEKMHLRPSKVRSPLPSYEDGSLNGKMTKREVPSHKSAVRTDGKSSPIQRG